MLILTVSTVRLSFGLMFTLGLVALIHAVVTVRLTFGLMFPLGLVALIHAVDAIVCDLQHPPTVYHTVARLEPSMMLDWTGVDIAHALAAKAKTFKL